MGDVHDLSYYSKCLMGGAMACGLTHAGICPVDIVKCRNQVSEPKRYPNMVKGIQMLAAEEGTRGLILGFTPTLVGYSA